MRTLARSVEATEARRMEGGWVQCVDGSSGGGTASDSTVERSDTAPDSRCARRSVRSSSLPLSATRVSSVLSAPVLFVRRSLLHRYEREAARNPSHSYTHRHCLARLRLFVRPSAAASAAPPPCRPPPICSTSWSRQRPSSRISSSTCCPLPSRMCREQRSWSVDSPSLWL
jgi:hypothetical protein